MFCKIVILISVLTSLSASADEGSYGASWPAFQGYSGSFSSSSSNNWIFSLGLSYSSITYMESGVSNYLEQALTLTTSIKKVVSGWEYGASAFGTVLPLTQSTTADMRFIGVNLRGGPNLISSRSFRMSLLAGLYYTTTLVDSRQFGFTNLWGPQIYLNAVWSLGGDVSLGLYGKYSAVMNSSLVFLPTTNKEMATGLALIFGKRKPFSIVLDVASLDLSAAGISAISNSVSSGVSFGF